jgi:hypothetical protein
MPSARIARARCHSNKSAKLEIGPIFWLGLIIVNHQIMKNHYSKS